MEQRLYAACKAQDIYYLALYRKCLPTCDIKGMHKQMISMWQPSLRCLVQARALSDAKEVL